jgi:hypothetical protein
MAWTPTRVLLDSALHLLNSDTVPVGKKLKNCWLALLKQPPPASFDASWGSVSINECDFDGYERVQITTWSSPARGQDGGELVINSAEVFECADTTTTNTVYGQALLGADSVTLLATEAFDNPISMAQIGQSLVTVPVFGFKFNVAGYGNSMVSS